LQGLNSPLIKCFGIAIATVEARKSLEAECYGPGAFDLQRQEPLQEVSLSSKVELELAADRSVAAHKIEFAAGIAGMTGMVGVTGQLAERLDSPGRIAVTAQKRSGRSKPVIARKRHLDRLRNLYFTMINSHGRENTGHCQILACTGLTRRQRQANALAKISQSTTFRINPPPQTYVTSQRSDQAMIGGKLGCISDRVSAAQVDDIRSRRQRFIVQR